MRKYGLIGYPLGHSFSQKYFSEKFIKEWITDAVYDNYPLRYISDLPQLISENAGLCGLNVTIPHKSAVIRYLNEIDSTAEEIGSVNVIKISWQEGRPYLKGFNSDVFGIEDSLRPYLKMNIRQALVLGTGGSSKSVCYVLKNNHINIIQVSREVKSGVITYNQLTDEILRESRLIINTTPLGMYPDIEGRPSINYSALGKDHILFDLVYNPEQTSFLRLGSDNGATTIAGIKMLHSQAERAWEIWNDNRF